MSRRTYEVINTSGTAFVEPRTLEEATERRIRLQGEIESLQAQLSDRDRRSNARPRILQLMNDKKQELRLVRSWLSNNSNNNKPSEWALLARAHRIVERLAPQDDDEAGALLDDIEFIVPGAYLQEKAARTG